MLRRALIFMTLVVVSKSIYDPSDETPTKTANHLRLHHNYSRVRIQRPSESVNNPRQPELVRIKRNKTRIEIHSKCPKHATGQYVFELSCNQFLNCWKGRGFVQNCAPGTLFNPKTLECDYAEKVQCITGPRQSMLLHHHEKLTEETQPGCPDGFSGIIPYYTDCTKFINCDRGREHVMDCGPGTVFDVNSNTCNYPQKAQCVNQESYGRGVVAKPVQSGRLVGQNQSDRVARYRTAPSSNGNYDQANFDQNLELSSNNYGQSIDRQSGLDGNLKPSVSRGSNIRRHQYRPIQNVATSYQSSLGGYDQNLESSSINYGQGHDRQSDLDENLEPSVPRGSNVRRQQYRPVQNVATSYQSSSGGYDQNMESSSNDYGQSLETSSSNRGQSNLDGNLESSASRGSNIHGHQYRPVQNIATSYQSSSGGYDQNLESASNIQEQSESFGGYARAHQVNSFRPNRNDQELPYSTTKGYKPYHSTHEAYQNSQREPLKCPEGGAGLYEHPYDCSKFLNCANGITYIQDCAPGTLFNPTLKICDFPYNVLCSQQSTNRQDQTVYEQQNKNYEPYRPVNQWHSSTRRPSSEFHTSGRPQSQQSNIDNYEQTVYEQQNKNYEHRPVGQWQNSTRRPSGEFYSSRRPQSNIDSYDQTVYEQQNKNYEHRPVGQWQSSTRRPSNDFYQSGRPQERNYGETVFEQQNKNYEHKPIGQWQHVSQRPQGHQSNIDNYGQTVYEQQNTNYQHRPLGSTSSQSETEGVIVQQTLYDGSGTNNKTYQHRPIGHWVAIEDDAPASSTITPNNGFYLTRPPQVLHTSKPRNTKLDETPDIDYVYEYDDDIIIDVQPAASNKKPQSTLCRSGQYTCADNQCISNSAVCDGFQDCSGGSDETNCDIVRFTLTRNNKLAVAEKRKIANTTANSCGKYCLDETAFQCRAFNYRKHDGVCYLLDRNIGLSGALIIYQIFDYYEMASQTIDCSTLFNCPNNKCVPYSKLCDGENDCGDRTDEKHCSAHALGYSIRLTGSPNKNEGRIEVTALGKTGYVCDDQFNMKDADVVCRELGFDLGALEVKANSYYAKGLGNTTFYLMDDVSCLGNESSLRDCDFNGWGVHNCMAQEVVGVVCKTPEEKCKEGYWQCDNEQECLPLAFLCDGVYDCTDSSDEDDKHCEAPIQLRLANGSTHLEGRVEIKHLGTWGTICDDDFNEDAAKVVCKHFGFDGSASVRKNGHFGPGKGPIWLDQVFCQGNESSIQDCVHWDWGEHNCDHSEDVGVICSQRVIVEGQERHRQQQIVEAPKVEPLQLLPERCGLRKDNIFSQDDEVHFRVVKGAEAKRGDYPWQASIRVKGKSKPTHWCGAVVISQRFVLTAAHCLVGFSKGAYIIVAGDYQVDEDEGTEQVALIEDFYLHEDFRKGQKMNNDIALVKLKGNGFTITEDIQPICLPDTGVAYLNGLNCTISGFGSTKSGKAFYSHVLRAGWLPLQGMEICKMPHIYGTSITDGMICAGFLDEGVDACDGDSGGPLACLHEGVFTLFGLTSWGQHCGYANKPGVYVKISHYRDWIEEKMRKYA